jgi:hypothetical protein
MSEVLRTEMRAERWLPVVGYEDLYEVSDLGSIRRSRGGRGSVAGRVLTAKKATNGYRHVDLSRDDQKSRFGIHRLVAMAFIGAPPSLAHQVNHKNADKSDNRAVNLEWATRLENVAHALSLGIKGGRPLPGELCGTAKLTWGQVAEIRALRGVMGARGIAAHYGVSRTAVQRIHQERNWRPENAPPGDAWPEDLRVRQFPNVAAAVAS